MSSLRDFAPGYDTYTIDDLVPGYSRPVQWQEPSRGPAVNALMEQIEADDMSELGKGFRSTRFGLEASYLAAEESSLRAKGEDEAADLIAPRRKELEARAELFAPKEPSAYDLKDNFSLRRGADWAAGAVGGVGASLLDSMAAGVGGSALAGGLSKVGTVVAPFTGPAAPFVAGASRLLGAAAPYIGEAVAFVPNYLQAKGATAQAEWKDPELMARTTAEERDRAASLSGAGQALIDTMIPGAMRRRMMGENLYGAAERGLNRVPLAAGVAIDNLGEGAQEVVQDRVEKAALSYLNPDRDTSGDWKDAVDNFAAGAIGTTPMSAGSRLVRGGKDRMALKIDDKYGDETTVDNGNSEENLKELDKLTSREINDDNIIDHITKPRARFESMDDVKALTGLISGDRVGEAVTEEDLLAAQTERKQALLDELNRFPASKTARKLAKEVAAVPLDSPLDAINLLEDDMSSPINRAATYVIDKLNIPDEDAAGERYNAEGIVRLDRRAKAEDNLIGRRDQMALTEERIRSGLDPTVSSDEATTYGEYAGGQRDFAEDLQDEFPAVHPTTEDVKARVKPKSPIIDPKSFVFDLTPDLFSDIGEVSPTRQEDALKGYPKPGETAKANAQRDKEIAHALGEYNGRLSFTARRLHTAANDAAPTSFVETNKIAEELQALTTLKAPTSASTRRGMRLADRVFGLVDGDGEVAKQLIYDIWHSSGGSKAFEPVVSYMESIADRTPTSYKVEQKTREDAADEIAKLIPASVQMQLMDEHGIDFSDAQTRDRMLEVMERHVDGRSGTTDAKLNELFTEPVVRSISNYLGRKIVPRLGGVTWSNVDDDGTVTQQQLSSDGVSLDDDETGGVLGDESDTSDYDRDGFQASLDALPPKAMIVPVSGGIRDLKDAWKEKDKGGVRSLLSLDKDGHDTLLKKIEDRAARVQGYLGDEHINYVIGDPGSKDPFVRAGATPVSKIMDRTGVVPLKRTEMMLEHMANDGQVDVGKANHALTAYRHLKRIDEDLSNLIAGRETVGPDGGKLSMREKAQTLSSTAEQLLALDPAKLQGIIGDKALTALKELKHSFTHGSTSQEAFYTRVAPAIHKWTQKAQQNLQQTIPYYDSYLKRNPEGDLDGFTREYFNERYMVVAAQNSNVDHMKMDPVTFEGLADKGARALSSVWTKAGDDVEESNRVRASMNLLHFKSPHGSLPPELAAKRRAERAAAKKAGVEYKQTPEQKAADDAQREVAIPAYALVEYAREGRYAHSDVTRNEADGKTPGQQQKEYRDLMMDGITTLIHSGLVTGLPWIHNAKGEREDFKSRTLGAAPGAPQQRLLFSEDRGELPPSLDLGGTTLAKHKENMAYGVKMQEKRRAEMGAEKRAEEDAAKEDRKNAELGADTFDGQTREQQDDSDVERMAIIGGRDEQRRDIELRTSELAAAADPLPRSMTPGKAVNLAKHVADGLWRDYVSDRAKGLQRIYSYVGSMDTIGSGSGKQYAAPLAALLSPANLARAHTDDLDTFLEIRRRAVQALIDLAYPKSGIAKIDRAKVRQIANVLSGATDAAIFAKDDKTRKPSKDGRPERERAELADKALLFGDNKEVPISKVESFLKSIASTPTVGLQSQYMNETEAAELAKLRPKANITAMDARQRAAIARSLGRLGDIFGHIARPYKFVAETGGNRGTTYSTHNTIGINFNALHDDSRWPEGMPVQHRLDWVMSHELGHAHDLSLKINGKPASLGGDSLKPGGWAYNEAEAARKKLPFLDWVYKYALEQPTDGRRARELFAQHIALLKYNKELLREHLPQTFAALVDSADDASPPGWSHEGGNSGSGETRGRDGSGVHGSLSGDTGVRGVPSAEREVPGQVERNDSKTTKEVGRRADGRAVSTTAGEEARKVETKEPRQVAAQATADTPKTTQKHTPSSPIQAPGAPETASVGVGSQKPAQGAKKDLDATVLKYSKMLDNPPDGFTTAHTEKIKTWAEKQYTKLGEELKAENDQKSDRAMELADQRSDLKALAEKAGASIAADKHSEQQTMGAQSTAADLSKDSEATPRAGGTVGGAHEVPSPVRKFDAYVQRGYYSQWYRDSIDKVGKAATDASSDIIRRYRLSQIPGFEGATIAADRSTVENIPTDTMARLSAASLGKIDRVMVGNHGVYVEFTPYSFMRDDVRAIKKHRQYVERVYEYDRTDKMRLKVYDQTATVNYADYRPGKWYVGAEDLLRVAPDIPGSMLTLSVRYASAELRHRLQGVFTRDSAEATAKLDDEDRARNELLDSMDSMLRYLKSRSGDVSRLETSLTALRKIDSADHYKSATTKKIEQLIEDLLNVEEKLGPQGSKIKYNAEAAKNQTQNGAPRVQIGTGFANHNAQVARDMSDRRGLTSELESMFATGDTVNQVITKLGAKLDFLADRSEKIEFVTGVRATLGIPSRATAEGKVEFDEWLKTYRARKMSAAISAPQTQTAPAPPIQNPGKIEKATQTTPEPSVQNPGKFEKATRTPTSIEVTAAVKAYFAKTLAPKVRVMLQEMFPELAGKGNASWDAENLLAKISTANPTKTMEWAYHEAMHAFFTTVINDKGMKDVRDMLFDVVGDDSKLYARLKDMLKESPVALEHMEKSKEERVAYAFQFWAADMLSIAKKPETFFEKVQALMRHVFGLVSNDEKAMMLFEAFNGGKLREPSAAGKAILQIMQTGEWRKNFLAKIDKQFQAVYTEVMANHLVYRTSESATFRKIGPKFVSIASYGADTEGAAGMIDKTRMKRGEYSNRIRDVLDQLKGPNLKRDLKMLVDALNEHTTPELAHVAKAKDEIHALIEDFYDYSQKAGLELGKQLGPDGKYWPRVMDLDKMINGKEAFIKMLVDNYPKALRSMKAAVQRANPKVKVTEVEVAHAVYQGIVDRMGNVDPRIKAMREDGVLNPYFAASNERHLDWIRDADIKPFLSEDVVGSLTQYFHQGVRAVEYKRAFGQDGIELQDMMATKGDLKYVDENGDAVRYDEDGPVRSELVAAAGKQGLRGKELDAWVNRRMDDYKRANGAMEGSLGKDISAGLRNFQSMAMTYQVVRLLPLMIFSSMLDPNGIRVAGGTADDMFNAYKRGFTGLWNNWKELLMGEAKDRKVDDLERAALDAMVINSDAEIEDMGTVHSSEYLSGVARRVNHAFFKAIGITQWDRDMRIMATDAARKAIVRDYNNAVPEHSERWLRELGLKRGDIFIKDGELIVSPEVLAAERGWSVAEARERLQPTHFAINRWVNRAIVSPNAGLRPTRASDPHFAMFFQFKSFTYAFQETTMRYALHEAENGNKTAAFQLLRGIPIMLAADLTKAMVTGGGSLPGYMANWTLADWLSHAINRSGVGGTTSFITDALGGNAVGVLAGPTVDHAVSTVGDVLSGNPGHALVQSLPGVRQLAMAGS